MKVQWEQNGGMCGVCGQPFDGLYLDGTEYTIVRSYNQGAYVNVTVEVKSNLLGYFEFRLCPRNNSLETLTHDCFERNMLWIEESWSTRYYVGSHGGIYDLHVRLPADTACSHCVFQWKYSTGILNLNAFSYDKMYSMKYNSFHIINSTVLFLDSVSSLRI